MSTGGYQQSGAAPLARGAEKPREEQHGGDKVADAVNRKTSQGTPGTNPMLRLWLGGWAAIGLGHKEEESSDGNHFIRFGDGEGPTFGEIYDMDMTTSLGEGAFACVVPASHSGRPCCAKIINKECTNQEYREKVLANVHLLLRNTKHNAHPNIVRYYDFGEGPLYYYCIMERLDGEELFDRVKDMCLVTETFVRVVMSQVLQSLKHVHASGFVHRDIKLENFRYESKDKDAVLKLLDFGMVRKAGDAWEGSLSGTLVYMAPEIVEDVPIEKHECFLTASDVWAAGICFYVLLTGREFVNHETVWDLGRPGGGDMVARIMQSSLLKNVSANARDLLQRLLTMDPHARITAASALEHPWFSDSSNGHVDVAQETYHLTHMNSPKNAKFKYDSVDKAKRQARLLHSLPPDTPTTPSVPPKRGITVPVCHGPPSPDDSDDDLPPKTPAVPPKRGITVPVCRGPPSPDDSDNSP